MLRVRHVDILRTQALSHGTHILHSPQTHLYGERQATLEDFAGDIRTLTRTVEMSTWPFGAAKLWKFELGAGR